MILETFQLCEQCENINRANERDYIKCSENKMSLVIKKMNLAPDSTSQINRFHSNPSIKGMHVFVLRAGTQELGFDL